MAIDLRRIVGIIKTRPPKDEAEALLNLLKGIITATGGVKEAIDLLNAGSTVELVDGGGNGKSARVNSQGAQLVQDTGSVSLPAGTPPPEVVYTQFFDLIGDGTGSKQMNVDGSVIPVVFKITPDADRDIIVNQIVIFLSDSQIQLKRFGFIQQLTTGFEIDLVQAGEVVDVVPFAVTNMDLIQFAGGVFGEFDNIDAGNNDALLVTFDFETDIRIVAGSLDELQARVNDDLTGLIEFTALMRGSKLREAT